MINHEDEIVNTQVLHRTSHCRHLSQPIQQWSTSLYFPETVKSA
jgi:hypothetical protein